LPTRIAQKTQINNNGEAIMRRIFFGTSTLVLGLATLMWPTAPVNGGKGHGGGHAAPARVGSVHYATRPAPARVAPVHVAPVRVAPVHVAPARVAPPVARSGSVRSEHYAGSGSRGGYSNRYSDAYFGRFRLGYLPYILSDGYQYFGYYDLPVGYQTVLEDDVTYYLFNGVYYQAYIIGGQTVYVVVPN
jgi:hypothetical protein